MSDITIILVCCGILLFGWLLRKYQDGDLPFSIGSQTKSSTKKFSNSKKEQLLVDFIATAFPDYVVKDKQGDESTAFICANDAMQKELAIIKVDAKLTHKKIQSMGGLLRITYPQIPSLKELQQDLQEKLDNR